MNKSSWFRQHWVFLTVLMAAVAARIVFSAGHGFSNDELSALVRTRLNGWNNFWFYGVTFGDMHPFLYQALLWIWVRFFGEGEFMVRLPGIILFIFGQCMVYNTLKNHVHQYAGLCYAVITGTLGFLIMHSTFARPYNAGVFFLIMMCCVYIVVKKTGNLSWREITVMGLGACGAILSHYFAGLVAFLFIGFSFITLKNAHKKGIFISGVLGVIGFLPHANATLAQLGKGGLQWLAPPDHRWLMDTLWLVLNESWFVVFLVILLIALLIAQHRLKSVKEGLYELVVFFILVLLLGYLISWFYTPILRDLVIVFLLPFLLIGVLGSISFQQTNILRFGLTGVSAVLLIHSFWVYKVMGTHHFGVFKEIGQQINLAVKAKGESNITFASNFNNIEYINYYLNTPLKEPIIDWDEPDALKRLSRRISSSKTAFFCYSFNNAYDYPVFMEMIRNRYPLIDRSFFTRGSHFVLFSNKKTGAKTKEKILFSGKKNVHATTDEFLQDIKIPAYHLLNGQAMNIYYKFECQAKSMKDSSIFMVATLEQKGKQVIKNGQPLFYIAYDQSELVRQEGFFYAAFNLPQGIEPEAMLHMYIWNPNRLKLAVGSWSLTKVVLPISK